MLEKKRILLSDIPYTKYATIYSNGTVPSKACILYFHGGGLLYGHREDLPELHLDTLTTAGFVIVAFDYPLAPGAKLGMILEDVKSSITHYVQYSQLYTRTALPYFLWGRSAGAYLCLLTASKNDFIQEPLGVLSYYGYGFLCDYWFQTPSSYYQSLPSVDDSCIKNTNDKLTATGYLDTHYSIYIHARQTGTWKDLLYTGREKDFYLDYTLRTADVFPFPLFCAHSTNDTDVPYAEFLELTTRFSAQTFIAPLDIHDFDRDESNHFTEKLLGETLQFLYKVLL